MLAGKQHQVGRGYYITSRAPPSLGGDDLYNGHELRHDRPSLSDERAAEEAFFNRQVSGADRTWPEEFARFDDRCGIDQLVKFLAQDLAQEFARNLPALSKKLYTKLHNTQEALKRLPEMPQNPEYEVRKSLLKFTTDYQNRLKSKTFAASWGRIAEEFKSGIIELKPRYRVKPDGFSLQRDPSAASDRESVFSTNNSPSVKRPRPIDLITEMHTPSAQRRRMDNGFVKMEETNNSPFSLNSPFATPGSTNGRAPAKKLEEIRSLIRAEREAGRPGEVPYDVIETLAMEAVKPWGGPLQKFLDATMLHLRRELDSSLGESFKELKKRQVYSKAQKFSREWLKAHRARISDHLERNYRMETTKIYTMDEESFRRHRAQEAHSLRRNRHFYRMKQYHGDHTETKPEDWDKMSAEARRKEELDTQKEAAKLGEDPYEVELGVASHVRGYYLTAAMRFIDVIAMHITSGLFPDLVADIERHLESKMGLDKRGADQGSDVFVALMEEEQSTAEKRIKLKAELQRFRRAVQEISDLNETVTRDSLNGSATPQQEDLSMEDADGDIAEDEV